MEALETTVLAEMTRRNPGIQAASLGQIIDAPARTILAALRRLEADGLVHRDFRALTEETRWEVTDQGRHALVAALRAARR